jgi:acyl transferase domain-containing protein
MPWPRGFLKRASINNFGYGGSNAHVIMEGSHLEEYLNGTSLQSDVTDSRKSRVFLLSAKDEAAATAMAINMQKYLRQSKHIGKAGFLDNLAYTLAERRSIFDWTIAVPARDTSDLAAALESSEVKPVRAMDHVPRLGFVFTGQGAQWYAMGRELIDAYPVFKETLLEAERHLQEFGAKFSLIG